MQQYLMLTINLDAISYNSPSIPHFLLHLLVLPNPFLRYSHPLDPRLLSNPLLHHLHQYFHHPLMPQQVGHQTHHHHQIIGLIHHHSAHQIHAIHLALITV
jgi:hypothetical protein